MNSQLQINKEKYEEITQSTCETTKSHNAEECSKWCLTNFHQNEIDKLICKKACGLPVNQRQFITFATPQYMGSYSDNHNRKMPLLISKNISP